MGSQPSVRGQRWGDPFVWKVGGLPTGGYSRCAGISRRGFAAPPPCPGRLRDAESHRPAAASRFSLPRGALGWPTAGDVSSGVRRTPSPPSCRLRWGSQTRHIKAASCPSPARCSQSSEHHGCAAEPRAESNPTCHSPLAARGQPCPAGAPGRWRPSPVVAAALLRGAGGALLPPQLCSCLPQLYSATLGELFRSEARFPGPRLQGDASNRGSWQHSPSLRAPARARRGTRSAPRGRRGWGF